MRKNKLGNLVLGLFGMVRGNYSVTQSAWPILFGLFLFLPGCGGRKKILHNSHVLYNPQENYSSKRSFYRSLEKKDNESKEGVEEVKNTSDKIFQQAAEVYEDSTLHEAKLYDIPVPLGVKRIVSECYTPVSSDQEVVNYEIYEQQPEKIMQFYIHEMDRLGWVLHSFFETSSEYLSIFEKPKKICIVSLRDGSQDKGESNKKAHLLLWIGPKK